MKNHCLTNNVEKALDCVYENLDKNNKDALASYFVLHEFVKTVKEEYLKVETPVLFSKKDSFKNSCSLR